MKVTKKSRMPLDGTSVRVENKSAGMEEKKDQQVYESGPRLSQFPPVVRKIPLQDACSPPTRLNKAPSKSNEQSDGQVFSLYSQQPVLREAAQRCHAANMPFILSSIIAVRNSGAEEIVAVEDGTECMKVLQQKVGYSENIGGIISTKEHEHFRKKCFYFVLPWRSTAHRLGTLVEFVAAGLGRTSCTNMLSVNDKDTVDSQITMRMAFASLAHTGTYLKRDEQLVAWLTAGLSQSEISYYQSVLLYYTAGSDSDLSLMRSLLSHGVDPDVECIGDITPLGFAAEAGALRSIELLMRHGVDPHRKFLSGLVTAFSRAKEYKRPESIKLMRQLEKTLQSQKKQ